MPENKPPKDGADVIATVPASFEHERAARQIRGKLKTRRVAVFDYTQCWVDGVEVDETTVRAAGQSQHASDD